MRKELTACLGFEDDEQLTTRSSVSPQSCIIAAFLDGYEITHNHADYRLLGRRAIEALRQYGESNLFLRALVMEIGFKAVVVSYDRAPRFAGSSKCPLRKMIALAPRRRHSIFYNAAPLHHAGRSTDLSRYRIYRKDLSRDQASTAFHNRSGPTRDQKRSEPSLAQNT